MLKSKGAVVHLDRTRKAKMIEALLEDELGHRLNNFKILDVGAGNGQISEYLAKSNTVYSVDVRDQRSNIDQGSVNFQLVTDETLPFSDEYFDIVISHHVIEHVANQKLHISEMKRVAKKTALIYLACPNKSSPFMAGHVGNTSVPTFTKIHQLLNQQKLQYLECYTRHLHQPKKYYCETKLFSVAPLWLLRLFRRWLPGHCFILRKS